MSQLLTDMANSATFTSLQAAGGNANSNGITLDLLLYKGPVTFILTTTQSTVGVGTLNSANIQTATANTDTLFADVTGGAFTAVVNTANASNVGVQKKTFDVRALSRWVRVPTVVSGTNANIPLSVLVVGQLERTAG